MNHIHNIPPRDFFSKKLNAAIENHNAALAELTAAEKALPEKRRDLARRVYSGEISGADALAELRQLRDRQTEIEIDRRVLLAERERINPDIQAALKHEADRLKAAAEERRAELTEALKSSGANLHPNEIALSVARDGGFIQMNNLASGLRLEAVRGAMHPDYVGNWQATFNAIMSHLFGHAEAPATASRVETPWQTNPGTSAFKPKGK